VNLGTGGFAVALVADADAEADTPAVDEVDVDAAGLCPSLLLLLDDVPVLLWM
jgi:hypothetical protein